MKTPVTKEKIQHHFNYSLWKYALLIVIAIFGWNLVFSATEYRPPEEKKIVMGVYAYGDERIVNAYMEQVRTERMPDMEEMNATYIMPDEAYGDMILTTRIAARDCDIYILPRAQFQRYAAQGAFMPLEEVLPGLITELEAAGVSLTRGNRAHEETGEKHQYAIPCADLPGMTATLQCDTSDMYIGVFYVTENDANVLKFFEQFIRDMLEEPVPADTLAE